MQSDVSHPTWGQHLMEVISRFINQTCHFINPIDDSDAHWEIARSILGKKPAEVWQEYPGMTDLTSEMENIDLKKVG